MIMVTNLNYFRHSAAGISCEVHVISFRGGRLTSLAIHFRNRRVYLFSKCFVFARWTIQLQIMCASSNIRTTTHARGITSGYQSINGPSNHASLRTQHTRRMCPQVRIFPGPDFHFGGMVIAVFFFNNFAGRRSKTDKDRPFLAATSACYTITTRCTSASSLRWLANLPEFPPTHLAK